MSRFVGPPPLDPPDVMGAEERACLLRAAREKLERLQDELKRLEFLPAIYAGAPTSACAAEIACLARGVSFLWRQHVR